MIISHQHRFVFIKTEKTAGTALEIALSRFCGPHDVITPISPEDEAQRRALGYRGPQHYRIPPWRWRRADIRQLLRTGQHPAFYNHASAAFIRQHIPPAQWAAYFKFCFERNPWDKAISWYYWKNRETPRPPLSDYVQSGAARQIRGLSLYTLDGQIAVDRVYLYEEMEAALNRLTERLGLPERPVLPRAKSAYRKDRRSYRDLLSAKDRDRVAEDCAREIALFGYRW